MNSIHCFAITRGDSKQSRIDVDYFHPEFVELKKKIHSLSKTILISKILSQNLQTGFPAGKNDQEERSGFGVIQIRPTQIKIDGEIDLTDPIRVKEENCSLLDILNNDEVLFNNTNSSILVGKSVVFNSTEKCVCSNHITRLTLKEEFEPQFIMEVLNWLQRRKYFYRLCTNFNNQAGVNNDALISVEIPMPSQTNRKIILSHLQKAREDYNSKLLQAEELLKGLDEYIINLLGIILTEPPRKVFAIKNNSITNALNPDRYRGLQIEKKLPFLKKINDVGTILRDVTTPSRVSPEDEWDWIRIDDLENHPWEVNNIRTELGSNIQGNFFEVKENDILIARLGPTIQNAKFVITPKLKIKTVASSEFLVLRCFNNWNPIVVLWILRTKLYREMMYLRTRGGTPSRYRLGREDLLEIPFPELNDEIQKIICEEAANRKNNALRLKTEAETEWQNAKKWFEEQLLNGVK